MTVYSYQLWLDDLPVTTMICREFSRYQLYWKTHALPIAPLLHSTTCILNFLNFCQPSTWSTQRKEFAWSPKKHKLLLKRLKMKANIENVEESNPRLAQILTTIPWYILSSGVLDTPLSKTSVIHSPMLSDIDFSLVVLRWPVTLHRYSPVSSAFASGITSLRLQSSCLEFSGRCLPSARYQLYVTSSPDSGVLIKDSQHHKFHYMVLIF